jgi:hypothetical protein
MGPWVTTNYGSLYFRVRKSITLIGQNSVPNNHRDEHGSVV